VQVLECGFVVHVRSFTVGAFGTEEFTWQRDAWLAFDRQRGQPFDRVGDQRVDGQLGVGDTVDERRVGTILEQATNEVGKQVFVTADRRVDATRTVPLLGPDDLVVKFFAHAVQALVFPFVAATGADRNFGDRRQGVRVVRRERRVESLRVGKKAPGTGQVGDVAGHLARKDGVVGVATLLRDLDLGVPVGALAQADQQAPLTAVRKVGEPVEQGQGAFLIGLDGQAEAVPADQFVIGGQRFDQAHRQFESLGLLGVDGQADIPGLGPDRQRLDCRQQLAAHALLVGDIVARVQCRELDRDRRRDERRLAAGRVTDGGDRLAVRIEVAQRVGAGTCGLAEHVVRVPVAGFFGAARALQCFMDIPPHDELLAENAHRGGHRLADHRFAGTRYQALENAADAALRGVEVDDLAGEHQRPGPGIDERAVRGAESLLPLGAADLVANKAIDGIGVGDAQQRFGQAHQHHAFAGGEVVSGQEGVDAAGFQAPVTNRLDQRRRPLADALLFGMAEACLGDQFRDERFLIDAVIVTQTLA